MSCHIRASRHTDRSQGGIYFGRYYGPSERTAAIPSAASFIGNTPGKLLHIERNPLLILKNGSEHPYHDILVPVDFSESSRRAAQLALAVAPNANVMLLNLIVMGKHGQNRVEDFLLGSVMLSTIEVIDCDILVALHS